MLSPLMRIAGDGAAAVKVLVRTGLLAPVRPDRLVGMGLSMARWGSSPAGAYAAGAARDPARLAVIDERESVSYAEIDRRSTAGGPPLEQGGGGGGGAGGPLGRHPAGLRGPPGALRQPGGGRPFPHT